MLGSSEIVRQSCLKLASILLVLVFAAGPGVDGKLHLRGESRRRLGGCFGAGHPWPHPNCRYNPWKENKFGDPNRVRTRYYNGQYIGRFDVDEEFPNLQLYEAANRECEEGFRKYSIGWAQCINKAYRKISGYDDKLSPRRLYVQKPGGCADCSSYAGTSLYRSCCYVGY